MLKNRNALLWFTWLVLTVGLTMYYAMKFYDEEADKSVFLPGATTHGHHQIELACTSCHSADFADDDAIQESCTNCHGEALTEANDKHPKSKFTDPRNADRLEKLDARYCVTCHVEHRPDMAHEMGVTLPIDYCHLCHEDIATERPSHEGMGFETCASAGCHNYHDNQALYEDFLIKHLHKPDVLEKQEPSPDLNLSELAPLILGYPMDKYPIEALALEKADAPKEVKVDDEIAHDWFTTAHAKNGVNCTACHQNTIEEEVIWVDKPDHTNCQSCHSEQVAGFKSGKHGMRLDIEKLEHAFTPMTTDTARLDMKKSSMGKELTCNSCHGAHKFDT
ncbi:MAG: cytochrome c3 family protein, partial [Gammaproteobacteria bacterium]